MATTDDTDQLSTDPSSLDDAERDRERIPAELRSGGSRPSSTPGARVKRGTHRWARWLHVYTSMVALLVVLFFGLTGITLNHPTWTFGDQVDVTTVTGQLPFEPTLANGSVDYLTISEYVREEYGVGGAVDSFDTTGADGSIAYRNAGYAADLLFDTETGEFDLTVEQQGWVAVMNDLHKGRDTGSAWKWVIDIAAGFLVVISLTGLTMQFFLRKRRRSALISAGVGAAALALLTWFTLA